MNDVVCAGNAEITLLRPGCILVSFSANCYFFFTLDSYCLIGCFFFFFNSSLSLDLFLSATDWEVLTTD